MGTVKLVDRVGLVVVLGFGALSILGGVNRHCHGHKNLKVWRRDKPEAVTVAINRWYLGIVGSKFGEAVLAVLVSGLVMVLGVCGVCVLLALCVVFVFGVGVIFGWDVRFGTM